jgi:hypothetical protein
VTVRIIRATPPPGKRPERSLKAFQPAGRGAEKKRGRMLAVTAVILVHMGVAAALIWLHFGAPAQDAKPEPAMLMVSVMDSPKPPGADNDADGAAPAPEIAPPPPPQVNAPVLRIARTTTAPTSDLLSESQIAGAARAGEGGAGGGGCDMARAVQQVLRRDPRVRLAVAEADRLGKASMLWNGDWVQTGGQEGKGLAVVRQAVIWEVGFAPAACRNAPMRGMILLSLADGRTSFAIGTGSWRWSDLLGLNAVHR